MVIDAIMVMCIYLTPFLLALAIGGALCELPPAARMLEYILERMGIDLNDDADDCEGAS